MLTLYGATRRRENMCHVHITVIQKQIQCEQVIIYVYTHTDEDVCILCGKVS